MRCNFRGVKVPFRRWLCERLRVRGVLSYASSLRHSRNAASTVLSRPVRVAYFRTRAVWGVRETPLDWCFHATCAWRTRISANISRLAKRPTPLLSQRILKIFRALRCNFRRVRMPFRRWLSVILGASKCQYKGGFTRETGRVAYLAYVSGLGRA